MAQGLGDEKGKPTVVEYEGEITFQGVCVGDVRARATGMWVAGVVKAPALMCPQHILTALNLPPSSITCRRRKVSEWTETAR